MGADLKLLINKTKRETSLETILSQLPETEVHDVRSITIAIQMVNHFSQFKNAFEVSFPNGKRHYLLMFFNGMLNMDILSDWVVHLNQVKAYAFDEILCEVNLSEVSHC